MSFEDSARVSPRIRRLVIEEISRQISEERERVPASNIAEIMRQQGLVGTAEIRPG